MTPDTPTPAEPLPCPFCGYEAVAGEIADPTHSDNGGHFIQCANHACGASTNLRFACGEDPLPLLVEQWNRRATPPEIAQPATPDREELLGDSIRALIRGDIKCSDDLPPEKRPQHVSARRAFGAVYNLLRATQPATHEPPRHGFLPGVLLGIAEELEQGLNNEPKFHRQHAAKIREAATALSAAQATVLEASK